MNKLPNILEICRMLFKMPRKNKLPDTLSALIRVAVKDMDLVKADPHYVLDMNAWHEPAVDVCHVCMAGSVIAKTLNGLIQESISPRDFMSATTRKLICLNAIRRGGLIAAWHMFYRGGEADFRYIYGPDEGNFYVPSYQTNYEKFKDTMLKFADMVEKEEIRKGIAAHGNV